MPTRKREHKKSSEIHDLAAFYGDKRMFSPASFFDIIDTLQNRPSQSLMEPTGIPPRPAIVAFYGFKGGAGRTVALAHVAIMLAQRGLKVAALDLDIEAPGLHVALGARSPDEGRGVVALLRKAFSVDPEETLGVADHLQVISPHEGAGKVFLLPAGRIGRTYLAQIEELNVGLWHEANSSPLERILVELKQYDMDVVFIDCRTGFSSISASVLFHLADLDIIFLPLTEQVWEGVEVLLQAVAATRTRRNHRPGLLFVPSMAPPGEIGREKVQKHLAKLSEVYRRQLNVFSGNIDQEENGLDDEEPWLQEGIVWDPRISAEGAIRQPFYPGGPWGIFQSLYDHIVASLDLQIDQRLAGPVRASEILNELQISGSVGFAEDLNPEQMRRIMVPSESVKAAIDRTYALVVGAKGSGKTLLWRLLIDANSDDLVRLPGDTTYVAGHAPRPDLDPQRLTFSPDAFKEMEQDARMRSRSTYKAFWILQILFRLSQTQEKIAAWLESNLNPLLRQAWKRHIVLSRRPDFSPLLKLSNISTMAEDSLAALDDWLASETRQFVVVYDGLDTGFQTGKPEIWYERRARFVTGLLQVVAEWRIRLKRVQFKVFLREDIYLSVELQNRSHLDATKHELRFGPRDLWQLALKFAVTSPTYKTTIPSAKEGPDGLFAGDDSELKALLYPLWGRTVEKGKKAYTANYILKRTSDAQGRLFPRTFIQMLDASIKYEKRQEPRMESDRVLRFKALQEGVTIASKQRVNDLRMEYVELRPYLEALRGAPAVAQPDKLISALKRNIGKPPLNLHLGSGGWRKVLDRLMTVGVLGKKPGEAGEDDKLYAALLYRSGLELKSPGLK